VIAGSWGRVNAAGWDVRRLYNGVRLPSARTVSVRVLTTSRVTPDDSYSHMLMQWGQFIDHDIDFVPTAVAHARFSDGRHCNETCDASGPCFPIPVSSNDPRVRRRRCIGFVRSSAMCGRYDQSTHLWADGSISSQFYTAAALLCFNWTVKLTFPRLSNCAQQFCSIRRCFQLFQCKLSVLPYARQGMSTGQSAVMLCGWEIKAGWLIPCEDKRVGGR